MPAASLYYFTSLLSSLAKPFFATFFIAAALLRACKSVRVIGVTGSIASGKSAFCRFLRHHALQSCDGAVLRVIDADEVARDITAAGATCDFSFERASWL
jgi:hypothetical protein